MPSVISVSPLTAFDLCPPHAVMENANTVSKAKLITLFINNSFHRLLMFSKQPFHNVLFMCEVPSADMMDDADFLDKIKKGIYQLAVVHSKPEDSCYHYVKCGHESLYISLKTGNPLSFYPEVHLKDLNGLTILLLSRIGFWSKIHRAKTPDSKYLLQVEDDSFFELASNSDYPIFSSSYFINRREVFPDRINIPIADPECCADYYLVCLASEKNRYEPLFKHIRKDTIK